MATNPAVKELYPFSTRGGESIPLEIISPVALIVKSFDAVNPSNFTLPAEFEFLMVYSELGCILEFGVTHPNPPLDGVAYANALVIPPSSVLTIQGIPGNARVSQIAGAGTLYLTAIRKWAALAVSQQIRVK